MESSMSVAIRINQENRGMNGFTVNNEQSKSETVKESNAFFAGNLTLGQEKDSLIEQKKQEARRQAMKLIKAACGRDEKMSQNIRELEQQKVDKAVKLCENQEYMKDFEQRKKALQAEYGIEDNSEEQKDLELLEKFQNYKSGSMDENFTKEEVEHLKELQNLPRTEYQNKILELNQTAGAIEIEASKIQQDLISLTATIAEAKTEQVKSQDMLKADKAADEILEASNKEIIGLLIQESKEHIEKEQQEEQKKADEREEKRDEQQERLDEAKEERKEQEKLINEQAKSDRFVQNVSMQKQIVGNVQAAQQNIQRILEENNIINEDLKGIEIDFNF